MPILTLNLKLPGELADEIDLIGANDFLIGQVSGESYISKIKPAGLMGLVMTYNNGYGVLGLQGRSGAGGSFTESVWNIDYQGWDATYGLKFKLWGWDEDGGYIRTTYHMGFTPAALGSAAAGTSNQVARGDHVHPMPTAAQVGAAPSTYFLEDANGLSLKNDVGFRFVNTANSAWARVDVGAIYYSTATQRSDPRLKRNIQLPTETPPKPSDLASAIIEFNFKEEDKKAKLHLGFNAETLATVAPSVVVNHPADQAIDDGIEGNIKGIDITALIAVLAQQLAVLENRLNVLENFAVKPTVKRA